MRRYFVYVPCGIGTASYDGQPATGFATEANAHDYVLRHGLLRAGHYDVHPVDLARVHRDARAGRAEGA
jgi:hypothetical protein